MKRLAILGLIIAIVLFSAYGALTFYDETLQVGRMWETPGVKPHEIPLAQLPAGSVPYNGGEALLKASDPESLTPSFSLKNPVIIAAGKKGYLTYCAQCHGSAHDGMGTVGQSFAPLPTDLSSQAVQSKSAGGLFHSVSYGIPGGRQPPLYTTISIEERWKIIGYVKSLKTQQ